jgi:hypothetical protein
MTVWFMLGCRGWPGAIPRIALAVLAVCCTKAFNGYRRKESNYGRTIPFS